VIPRTRMPAALVGLVGLVGLTLTGTLLGATPAPAAQIPTPGAVGIGDAYFPHDGNGGIDVLHYDVRDAYRFGSGRLTGRTRLQVRATQDLSRFDLDFLLPVRSVKVDGKRARFRQLGDHELRITPAAPLASGTQFRVSVAYRGTPATESSQGEHNWLADDDEVVAMNEPHMATWWFPANDHPRDKATFDIRITVPRGKDVVANGVHVSTKRRHGRTTSHWRAVEPMAPYLAFFGAGSFAISRSTCLGVPNVFAVSQHAPPNAPGKVAKHEAHETCRILTDLSAVLGPYPFSAMGGVVTSLPVAFALENQTRPTYPSSSGVEPGLLTHELAHQWFGDLVSVNSWRDIWLNEGFASFMPDYLAELSGGPTTRQRLDQTYDALKDESAFWALSIDDPGPVRLFDGVVYSRGDLALQALRQRIGDTAFWTLLRTWLSQHAYGNGSVPEFEALAASVSGQDLTGFFDAWLHAKVRPDKTAANGLM
jgi:aminopeptidase N